MGDSAEFDSQGDMDCILWYSVKGSVSTLLWEIMISEFCAKSVKKVQDVMDGSMDCRWLHPVRYQQYESTHQNTAQRADCGNRSV